ncbi:hypothetical protein FCL40_14740 [Ferrimonas sediminicola]|uniref:Uncharacterized protein n=1 Tax=Ferrimonas sediminicola TaxID=2569538 RepID=A0A4V5NV44_9GAMM|nr:hypothetical protein [Ferrimonas sediminicola]TKB47990.1 hypothetical protein FCL40_14740 [Ferrimonas sediminicola]
MSGFPKFNGNRQFRTKAGKYSLVSDRHNPGGVVIRLIMEFDDDEKLLLANRKHPELCAMVAEVKRQYGDGELGGFYINEYKQVIVPANRNGADTEYYLAGEYHEPLKFTFDGQEFHGDLTLAIGENWHGPAVGMRYKVNTDGTDIEYETEHRSLEGAMVRTHRLSKAIGRNNARDVAQVAYRAKGHQGGRLFVNEFGRMFVPVHEGYCHAYRYAGVVDMDLWFPKPE